MAVPPQLDPLVAHLLQLGLINPEDIEPVTALVLRARAPGSFQFDEQELLGVAQGLGRGVERIALAVADAALGKLSTVPAADRAAVLAEWQHAVNKLMTDTFGVLFAHRLGIVLRRRLEAPQQPAPSTAVQLTAGFVDLRGSTAFLMAHSDAEIATLADELYAVGQAVAARHDIVAGKFLGDGVLLMSIDPGRLRTATLETVAELGRRTPLRAGAGVAHGRVVRRAGDWHGPPVNLAARLAELAGPDEVLVDGEVGGSNALSIWREVHPRGLGTPRRVEVLNMVGP